MGRDIRELSRFGSVVELGSAGGAVRPRRAVVTRFILPISIVLAAAGVLAYSAREALVPTTEVLVAPVVVRSQTAGTDTGPAPASVLVQAPGWVEPAPYAVTVPALVEGVVESVLVLEGQAVSEGDVVARLIDADARLALERACAELHEREAEAAEARAAVEREESLGAELRDQVRRAEASRESGGIAAGEFARLKLRLEAQEAAIEAARSAAARASAAVERAQVEKRIAELALQRTTIRAPSSGVVLSRLVEPGSRIMLGASGGDVAGAVVRLYDPARLQARVEVPQANAATIHIGQHAEITTEALEDRVFHGVVSRVVHEANIQRNTVQVKVSIEDPDPVLKPEMLVRVRILGNVERAGAAPRMQPSGASGQTVFAPIAAVREASGDRAIVWLADRAGARGGHALARRREIRVRGADESGFIEVLEGLRPGDRLILGDVSMLRDGQRVRPREEASSGAKGGPDVAD